jgi:polysaccharide deacetylase family protein (PEP-CTERM system associated)
METTLNALTVDVEDYFHVSAFTDVVPRSQWDHLESRVCRNTERILDILSDAGVRATFFVLGWVAERHPDLVRRIHAAGHELASHSYEHRLVYDLTPNAFRQDLRRAKQAIEQASGVTVAGYRAPSFSITQASLWALDVLLDEGYRYDASIYPIRHDRYGIPDWDRHVSVVARKQRSLLEVPGSTVRRLGLNLPVGGGGYFRQFPYWWTASGIASLNTAEHAPAVFYLHPWEIDPDQPRIRAGRLARLRHYRNLEKTESRLKRLLREFAFGTVSDVLALREWPLAYAPAVGIETPAYPQAARPVRDPVAT